MSSVVFFVLCSKCQGLKICDIRKTHMATRFTLHMALKNNNTSRKLPRVQRKTLTLAVAMFLLLKLLTIKRKLRKENFKGKDLLIFTKFHSLVLSPATVLACTCRTPV